MWRGRSLMLARAAAAAASRGVSARAWPVFAGAIPPATPCLLDARCRACQRGPGLRIARPGARQVGCTGTAGAAGVKRRLPTGCSVVLCTVMTSSSCSPSRKHAVGVFLSPPLAAPRAAVFAAPRLVAARAFSTGSLDLVLRQADSALADVAKAKALIMAAKWNDLDAEELEDMAAGVGRSVSACMSLSFPYPLLFSLFSLALSCCRGQLFSDRISARLAFALPFVATAGETSSTHCRLKRPPPPKRRRGL